ncbi:cyclopropane-fatty-acyl-phospholipid synthase family protein [Desulfurispirillum indicum]|uniref:SAM-dependent methyltransferase n=1 Tax=Desulfurispirillum indicum TaxID=936456 RepID=UPI001CF99B1B|nr:cyclopropane-fatty-acyl-phospholipid synthase family protein [Desulfurispirillum indicum]UCZ56021.1 cyclopropane-fatty-acyl-phospholipid synthase family protein [Desulfurispirillum indicum]
MLKTFEDVVLALAHCYPEVNGAFRLWNGRTVTIGNHPPCFTLHLHSEQAARRLLREGSLGFGEEYMAGTIDIEGDIQQLLRLGMDRRFRDTCIPVSTKARIFLEHLRSLNTIHQSRTNISSHYDHGNDFYQLWLDTSLAYSCAYFRTPQDSLEAAQQQKYELICRKLRLQPGETLLDIGCGWGGMMVYAARHYQAHVRGITLSEQQYAYTRERIRREGLGNQLEVRLQDYRDTEGQFDKFVSIGMFEHVGKKFIPTYMQKVHALLKPGGLGLLHTIGKDNGIGKNDRGDPWISRYIFPGGYIPLLDEILRAMGNRDLVALDMENLRLHYALTLGHWIHRFEQQVDRIQAMTDESFVRMWRIYFHYCQATFQWGQTRLYQILFSKGLQNDYPLTRNHMQVAGNITENP